MTQKKYVIYRHPAISGVSVAKKPKSQLIASILFLVSFWLKKVEPKSHLFENISMECGSNQQVDDPKEIYGLFLESLEKGIIENYGESEINRVVDIRALK